MESKAFQQGHCAECECFRRSLYCIQVSTDAVYTHIYMDTDPKWRSSMCKACISIYSLYISTCMTVCLAWRIANYITVIPEINANANFANLFCNALL